MRDGHRINSYDEDVHDEVLQKQPQSYSTDISSFLCFSVFQFVCVPFVALSPAVSGASPAVPSNTHAWLGELKLEDAGKWTDEILLLVSGVKWVVVE